MLHIIVVMINWLLCSHSHKEIMINLYMKSLTSTRKNHWNLKRFLFSCFLFCQPVQVTEVIYSYKKKVEQIARTDLDFSPLDLDIIHLKIVWCVSNTHLLTTVIAQFHCILLYMTIKLFFYELATLLTHNFICIHVTSRKKETILLLLLFICHFICWKILAKIDLENVFGAVSWNMENR